MVSRQRLGFATGQAYATEPHAQFLKLGDGEVWPFGLSVLLGTPFLFGCAVVFLATGIAMLIGFPPDSLAIPNLFTMLGNVSVLLFFVLLFVAVPVVAGYLTSAVKVLLSPFTRGSSTGHGVGLVGLAALLPLVRFGFLRVFVRHMFLGAVLYNCTTERGK